MTTIIHLPRHPSSPAARRAHQHVATPIREGVLLVACLALLALATWGPTVLQSSHYHDFADQRTLLGVPNLMDVLSNVPFAVLGMLGIWRIRHAPPGAITPAQRRLVVLLFLGMVLTAVCSGWYHLVPDDTGLAIDRAGMSLAFAGLLGLAAASAVSNRAGHSLAITVLAASAWSIHVWSTSGNLLPWAVLQAGVIALVLGIAMLPRLPGALAVSWITVILAYALAKFLELADAPVYHLTHELVSGHTLKHLVASFAAWPVLSALTRATSPLESPAHGATASLKR